MLSHLSFRNDGIKAKRKVLGLDCAHPASLRRIGRKQIEKYGDGIEFVQGEAIKIRRADFEDEYRGSEIELEQKNGKVWKRRKMILVVGSRDAFPDVEGYSKH